MKVIVLSDLHGHLPKIKEEFDLMLICGDIIYTQGGSFWFLVDEFSKWINHLPYRNKGSRVFLIAGNHDFIFEKLSKDVQKTLSFKIKNNRLIYLDGKKMRKFRCNGKSYSIFGTPYCKVFGNWAFMKENLDEYYKYIPENLDFLISHDAADINDLGIISEGFQKGKNAGNSVLARYVKELKPKYYFCGHIHSGNHNFTEINGTKMANVSIMDESYTPTYKPLVFEV